MKRGVSLGQKKSIFERELDVANKQATIPLKSFGVFVYFSLLGHSVMISNPFLIKPLPGEDSHVDSYVSDGLKPPTRYSILKLHWFVLP